MSIFIGALVAAVFALVLIHFLRGNKKSGDPGDGELRTVKVGDRLRRLKAMQQKNRVLTAAALAETPDDALLETVLSNLWAKMAPDLSDAKDVLSGLSEERRLLFALYAVTGGVREGGFSGLLRGEDAAFVANCEKGLEAIGAAQSAQALREALRANAPDDFSDAYTEAFDREDGMAKMVAFIRQNSRAFVDLA